MKTYCRGTLDETVLLAWVISHSLMIYVASRRSCPEALRKHLLLVILPFVLTPLQDGGILVEERCRPTASSPRYRCSCCSCLTFSSK